MRLVDGDIGQIVEDLCAAVGRGARGQQLRALVDERCGDAAGLEVPVIQNRLQERNIRRHSANPELRDRPARPGHRRREVTAPTSQLNQHGIEVRADLGAQVGAAVQPDARTTGGAQRADAPGVWPEAVGRILGGDPAL